MLTIVLVCAAVLLALAPLAVALARNTAATQFVYGVSMVASAISLVAALLHLLSAAAPESIVLPVGVPWLGAHLRLDALSAFFLVVIDLGAMSASLFALGYGRHETAPGRVLPFYPAFLAAMTLVLVADDAYTFLLSLGVHVAHVMGAGDGASSRARKRACRIHLSGHGEFRDDGFAAGVRPTCRA